jgi:hypothetical protein
MQPASKLIMQQKRHCYILVTRRLLELHIGKQCEAALECSKGIRYCTSESAEEVPAVGLLGVASP